MLRALTHYWRINLAVALAAAVATAVLAGALLVGDSVRGSLRDLTLDRLGGIDDALVAPGFFREDLGADSPGLSVAPAILLRGAAVHGESGARAARVAIHGVDERFFRTFAMDPRRRGEPSRSAAVELDLSRAEGQVGASAIVNRSFARELGLETGDGIVLTFGRASAVPRDSLMGETDPEEVLANLRVTVIRVLPDRGIGRFGLDAHQQNPLNVFVALKPLQRALGERGRVNSLFHHRRAAEEDPAAALEEQLTLEDFGLTVETDQERGQLVVESEEFVLRPDVDLAVETACGDLDAPMLRVQTYLANAIRGGSRMVPYSLITAVDPRPEPESFSLRGVDGSPLAVSATGILLNTWTAEDLGARIGDPIEIEYYLVGPREELRTERATLSLEGIAGYRGLGGDRTLTPEFPGIESAQDIASWDPPFPIDLDRIRPRDEEYWDLYETTPKAFVSEETGRELWTTRYGTTTSVRVAPPSGISLVETERRLRETLRRRLPGTSFGLAFRPVRNEGIEAATGATDFSGLFIGFSFFLIVSSALLIGLLFSLGVEQRAKEIGLLLAVGYPLRRVRARCLAEGLLLGVAGALLGVAGAIGYAWLLIAGLRTLWVAAVGSTQLYLHVRPGSLAIGAAISVLVMLLSILGTVIRLGRVPPPSLLAGSFRARARPGRRRVSRVLAFTGLFGGIALLVTALLSGRSQSPGLAFGTGVLLLVSGLAFFSLWCRGTGRGILGTRMVLLGMAARNSAWSPGRSMLSVALVASACFVIVTVAANRREFGEELRAKESGGGGFSLIAESDVPLHQRLGSAEDRFELGFSEQDSRELEGVEVYPFGLLPGDDASCLNLYQPEKPRVLGVPTELIRRGGFEFAGSLAPDDGAGNPWPLLESPLEPGVLPAVADANSAQWILHRGLGDDVVLEDESGREIRLRLVGLLARSIFQSEILISESDFRKHFPSRSGHSFFLIDAPFDDARRIASILESNLGRFGFDSTTTGDRLAGFQAVEHTYLSTFQALGGLGLLLGTAGLGIVLVRNVIERRAELATLRAFGFRRSSLAGMVLAENAFLLLTGILVGSLSALIAVAPGLAGVHAPWPSVAGTLGAVAVVGMLASAAAVVGALRAPLLPVLKNER